MIHPVTVFRREQLFAIRLTRACRQQLAVNPLDHSIPLFITGTLLLIRRWHITSSELGKNIQP